MVRRGACQKVLTRFHGRLISGRQFFPVYSSSLTQNPLSYNSYLTSIYHTTSRPLPIRGDAYFNFKGQPRQSLNMSEQHSESITYYTTQKYFFEYVYCVRASFDACNQNHEATTSRNKKGKSKSRYTVYTSISRPLPSPSHKSLAIMQHTTIVQHPLAINRQQYNVPLIPASSPNLYQHGML